MMQGSKNERGHHGACAACKHQRKKCREHCALAPYFPASKNEEFQAVHAVFGVSNLIKLVKRVRKENRKTMVESLIWEAKCRLQDPVLGSSLYKIMYDNLRQQIHRNNNCNRNQNHHQILQLPLPHHQLHPQEEDLKNFQNHLVVNGESSSVEDGWGFTHPNNKNNMSVVPALYGLDSSSQITSLNTFQQNHLPKYHFSGNIIIYNQR
ncbi:hypothetical protein K1719_031259 [Acacia pycnantha]|nr:hypothetical protein K1719_031259 [Acacia pycnantha]